MSFRLNVGGRLNSPSSGAAPRRSAMAPKASHEKPSLGQNRADWASALRAASWTGSRSGGAPRPQAASDTARTSAGRITGRIMGGVVLLQCTRFGPRVAAGAFPDVGQAWVRRMEGHIGVARALEVADDEGALIIQPVAIAAVAIGQAIVKAVFRRQMNAV